MRKKLLSGVGLHARFGISTNANLFSVRQLCVLVLLFLPQQALSLDTEEIRTALPVENNNKGFLSVNPSATEQALVEAPLAIPVVPEYVIDPPDSVSIYSRHESVIRSGSGQVGQAGVTIRPDGIIRMPLIGEFFIQGLTARQAAERLEQLYLNYYKEIDIVVEVTGFSSKFLYVVGESGPTAIAFKGNQRILDVLLNAGYVPKIGAKLGDIKIVRMNQKYPDHPQFFSINLNKLILEGDIRQNMYLQSGDIVRVPATLLRRFTYGMSTIMEPFGPVLSGAATANAVYNLKDQFEGNSTGGTTVVAPIITTPSLSTGSSSASTGTTNTNS